MVDFGSEWVNTPFGQLAWEAMEFGVYILRGTESVKTLDDGRSPKTEEYVCD
jgi:hypothetical protein